VSVDVTAAAVRAARIVIAQINPWMPRVHGDGQIHRDQIHFGVEVAEPLPEKTPRAPTPAEARIGELVAGLPRDGSTLQAGIGSIPDAVLGALSSHRHLGLHSEMWSDGALELIRKGVIDNSRKKVHAGKSVSAFVIGSRRLYDFVHDNPSVIQLGVDYVNMPVTIARNPKVVAINSAVEIDLTGQVCADSVGARILSGVGGQMDFMRGAALSPGGKPIIAITSRTHSGQSRIVPSLRTGAGVVTTRAHVHSVVTEHGTAELFGKTLGERATLLIGIAHPEDRETLGRQWRQLWRGA
jgi:acyl-CoA hydrolase